MSLSKVVIFGVLGAAALAVMADKAGAAEAPPRRKVTGRSGLVWFVQGFGGDKFGVFASETGNDQVIGYQQNDGKRVLFFEAPSTLTAKAKADFL